jgi:hypothetical protein
VDYRNSGQPYRRPELASFKEDWGRTTIEAIKPLDERLIAVTKTLSKTHVNGGAVAAQFRIVSSGAAETALVTDRLKHVDFFAAFFDNDVVQAALPQVENARPTVGSFEKLSVETLIDSLAQAIGNGGAYRNYQGADGDALRLARRFAEAAFDRRMTGKYCWANYEPWTDWFFDVAWDRSYFCYCAETEIATVLLTTDTD